ncbi:MAG: hypothetical protein ACXVP0_14690 [Bacteroidia bacterium]
MNKYSYDLVISASNENEADTKMKALGVLARKLSAAELSKLAHIVEHDPVKTALAKRALGV